jgi:vacuolar-type H+-ATPase subunit H
MANEEAKELVERARSEAEIESEKIGEVGRANIANLKKNISSSFDAAVESIVSTILGDAITQKTLKPKK